MISYRGQAKPVVNHRGPILLAEDNENDALLVRVALQKAAVLRPLVIARDGQEAIDYLAGQAPYADRARYPLPALLLLDLKMPRVNGFQVLAWLQERPDLAALPVVVLSSSAIESDIARARQLGADDYRVKPPDFQALVKIVQELSRRWLQETRVP
jgi:CheY-like chemotaxis protein